MAIVFSTTDSYTNTFTRFANYNSSVPLRLKTKTWNLTFFLSCLPMPLMSIQKKI